MWRKLYFHNEQIERGFNQLIRSGIVITDRNTGRVKPTGEAMDANSNWLYFGHTTVLRDCYLWHHVMFNHFDLVPEFCKLRCYKVVTKVRNFIEAIQFYNAMLGAPLVRADLMPLHGKVGIDERPYTDSAFNGFVYCDGPDDAREKFEVVRELVSTQIPTGTEINVIIKRSCTEMEKQCGATNTPFWQRMTPDELDLQHHLEDIFVSELTSAVQPDWIKNKVITKMVRWANTIGDKSWLDYFDGPDFLTMKAVTYHLQPKQEEPQLKMKSAQTKKLTKNKEN